MITIVESGGANIASIRFALERLNVSAEWTSDVDKISKASRVMLPGVGAAGDAMQKLRAKELDECVKSLTCPVLGICLGMQMLFSTSAEGQTDMLDIIKAPVVRLTEEVGKTIPHMGWNDVMIEQKDHPLMQGLVEKEFFYFVHSYYAPLGSYTVGRCDYFFNSFSAIVIQDNFMGCQFHPERSGAAGSRVLENFIRM
ncbi:MAG: imidazole glycerol phosphate synthase subunit HisH [Alphaproteobacteria bacterium CG1_02_46_17]|nr:MAG: imidazole glycerol phosphate synthase subunit HisH [Alphaproteobacteria bacterium CG1_02_46_17]